MKNDKIVVVEDVSMMFNLGKERVDSLKEFAIKAFRGNLKFDEFWALKEINFEISRGESIGIMGLNGSGKSTLLKIIAGVMKPTKGTVIVRGSVAPLIELGAGFDFDLSAKENVFLNGAILGFSKKEMNEKYEEIIDFAELWDFVDVPMKNFSSGMSARLGFAIATSTKPEILIADEILSVGDFQFKQKCENRMSEIMNHGTTVILVSHDTNQIEKMCQRAIWLEKGNIRSIGDVNEVSKLYFNAI